MIRTSAAAATRIRAMKSSTLRLKTPPFCSGNYLIARSFLVERSPNMCLLRPAVCLPLLATGLVIALPQQAPPAQQPDLRTQSNAVLVPALVKDKSGEIVYGLKAEDFIIEDDGVEQPIHMDEEPDASPISLVVAIQ